MITALRATWRLFLILSAVAVPSYLITYSGDDKVLMAWQNSLDVAAFAFAASMPILNRNRTFLIFTAPRFRTAHFFSLGWLLISIGVCISAMSAVHWRSSGHLASLNDGGTRVTFRILYDLGFVCLLLASGDYEVDLSWERTRTVLLTLTGVGIVVALVLFGDTVRDFIWSSRPMPDWGVVEQRRAP